MAVSDDWNPDTGGRSLAEILREAGIESAARAGKRRRWDDPEEAGLRQRRAEAAADTAAERAGFGRRKSDHETPPPPVVEGRERDRDVRPPRRPLVDPATAAIPGLRPDRKPGVPSGPTAEPDRRVLDRRLSDRLPQRERTERPLREERPVRDEPPAREERPVRQERPARKESRRQEQHPSTGPIPVVRPADLDDADLDSTPQESALAWLRFAGELLIALAVGIGVYFAATVLWENVPYVAVLLVPIAVTGLVAGVGAWRTRMGREPVGTWLLAVLVLACTLLAIVPAASVIVAKG
jgi:hypothetical protein